MIADMVKAHLQNVKSAIAELEQQKISIDNEIAKLNNYLQQGVVELNTFESSVENKPTAASSDVNVNNKYFLGE